MTTQEPRPPKSFSTLVARPNADVANGGAFALPKSFNTKKHASQYVEDGPAVEAAAGMQPLQGLPWSAPGWKVWLPEVEKGKESEKKKHTVSSGGKTYVLLFRPAEVQEEVNEAYASISKERCDRSPEVVAADALGQTGMAAEHLVEGQVERKD